MIKKIKYNLLIFITACSFSCGKDYSNNNQIEKVSDFGSAIKLQHPIKQHRNTSNIAGTQDSIYINKEIKSIRENCRRINLITNWSSVKTEDLFETTEGGEATYYYLNGRLEKITTQNFGETFQQIREYYLKDTQLCFVFEKSYQYNRPMYYDINAMKENNDTEAFDMDKSKITEKRSYFENGKLLRQTGSGKNASYNIKDSLDKENKMMLANFQRLMIK